MHVEDWDMSPRYTASNYKFLKTGYNNVVQAILFIVVNTVRLLHLFAHWFRFIVLDNPEHCCLLFSLTWNKLWFLAVYHSMLIHLGLNSFMYCKLLYNISGYLAVMRIFRTKYLCTRHWPLVSLRVEFSCLVSSVWCRIW